jgi:hypothetical protein
MKKIVMPFLFIIVIFSACQKSELKYSCDANIDAWVKSNLAYISIIGRNELIQYERPVQHAILNAFTSSQRFNVWIDKIKELQTLNWTEDEMNHILKLQSSLKVEWYTNGYNQDKIKFDEVDKFFRNWVNEGMAQFGWQKKFIISMLITPETVIDKNGTLLIKRFETMSSISPNRVGPPPICNCYAGPNQEPCGDGYCVQTSCNGSGTNCGYGGVYPCNGLCTPF